ncbi:XcbB/CpsF family capsular polysaccharide biosynthesis protein [Spelaeicoccus albus]|uniref:XcbB/CpsF family capsular polysaccharide biosynthesis protein n=1 Tax=Spelaeicoccus albus TaxID=1280376 RepID=A0A7Z0AAC9_9MICO|nr:XcbB/CpsF family capsular polysaccharide biosynthesis protein [Spelaeicoccus albus]NYI66465.1 hypothetical protein [Spelaeicoccus albus]
MSVYVHDVNWGADHLEQKLRDGNGEINFVHVNHNDSDSGNLIRCARKSTFARDNLIVLANHGYYSYMSDGDQTRFVHEGSIPNLWKPVKDGKYDVSPDGLIFSVSEPQVKNAKPKLVVLFASMFRRIYTPYLVRHMAPNFMSLQKYISQDAYVVRLADIGGILGSFYLNTRFCPDNTSRIQRLLNHLMLTLGVNKEDIVLYGGSKGGTGALFHGLLGGYQFVSVDPIVSDRHYEDKLDDMHFTSRSHERTIFDRSKDDTFAELMRSYGRNRDNFQSDEAQTGAAGIIVTSERSPQYKYITNVIGDPARANLGLFESSNPKINSHPEVSRNTIHTVTMGMNAMLAGVAIGPGVYSIV